MRIWLIIFGVALATFLLRASFLLFANPHKFPHAFRQALTFVPPAVLAAIVAPGLFMPLGAFDATFANPRWIAGLIALGIALRLSNPLAPIAAGLPALWFLQWAMG
jgi:branched-subunit amino acid transport protein